MGCSTAEESRSLKALLLQKSVLRGSFLLSSGKTSDFYIDSKQTTLDPLGAKLTGIIGWAILKEHERTSNTEISAIGGLTMGGDPIALAIAMESLGDRKNSRLQAFSVRKQAKPHGRNRLIEGDFVPGKHVVVVDDVVTTGGSTLQAVKAVREAGGIVDFVLVLVDRQEDEGLLRIESQGVKVVSIFRKEDLISDAPHGVGSSNPPA